MFDLVKLLKKSPARISLAGDKTIREFRLKNILGGIRSGVSTSVVFVAGSVVPPPRRV